MDASLERDRKELEALLAQGLPPFLAEFVRRLIDEFSAKLAKNEGKSCRAT